MTHTSAGSAHALIARADKYLNTGSGEYASDIMRDMAEYIRASLQPATVDVAATPMLADIEQIISDGWRNGKSAKEVAEEVLREFGPAQASQDWKAEAARRFGPIPPGDGENTRLIAAYHYAFEEGAKAALAHSSTVGDSK